MNVKINVNSSWVIIWILIVFVTSLVIELLKPGGDNNLAHYFAMLTILWAESITFIFMILFTNRNVYQIAALPIFLAQVVPASAYAFLTFVLGFITFFEVLTFKTLIVLHLLTFGLWAFVGGLLLVASKIYISELKSQETSRQFYYEFLSKLHSLSYHLKRKLLSHSSELCLSLIDSFDKYVTKSSKAEFSETENQLKTILNYLVSNMENEGLSDADVLQQLNELKVLIELRENLATSTIRFQE